jgi:hypothetical protein
MAGGIGLAGKRLIADSERARSLLAEARALAALLDDALPAAALSTGAVRSRILCSRCGRNGEAGMFAWLTFGPRLLAAGGDRDCDHPS